ncbi:MAG TPA: cysteine--tRNA ligase [Terrimicrobiaceae bacterium]
MSPRFFNTLTREIEEFRPTDPGHVRMYTCGPTVYDYAHIGNFRAYVFEDLLQRHLEFRGYKIERVMNLTDVDDKTIQGCRMVAVPLSVFTQPFKKAFFEDLEALRIRPANHFPEATAAHHIARMIAMIAELIERGCAYRAEDGSVYFRLSSFPRYGALAHFNLDELQSTGRVRSDEYEKEQAGDFALWKAWDEQDGDVWWESPWGRGRPGWHIECSAMATEILGPQIDIHCGGEDNIFPHHEAEIAQTESVTNMPFVRLWMHCKHLLVEGRKMSKSENNFFTLRDLDARGWSGREVRYVLIAVKYREPLNFTFESLEAARKALLRYDEWFDRLSGVASPSPEPLPTELFPEKFGEALDDDLNISAALGALFALIRDSNRLLDAGRLTPGHARSLLEWREKFESVLGFSAQEEGIPTEVRETLARRAEARARKEWALSDALRDQLLATGWHVKDTKEGQKLSRKN